MAEFFIRRPFLASSTAFDGSKDPVMPGNYAHRQFVDQLKRVPDVSNVTIIGKRRCSIRVRLDPETLAKLWMTATEVENAVAQQTMQTMQAVPGKSGEAPTPIAIALQHQTNALGQLTNLQQFRNIVPRTSVGGDAPAVSLPDPACINLGALQYISTASMDEYPAVLPAILRPRTANAMTLDRSAKETMPGLAKRCPESTTCGGRYDMTRFVSPSITEALKTSGVALALALGVVNLLLLSWCTVPVPMIAIAAALIATLAVTLVIGFSLDAVSMPGAPQCGISIRSPPSARHFISLGFLVIAAIQPALAAPAPLPAVTVATVEQHNVAPAHSFVGRVIAIQSVQIVPRVTAFIDAEPVKQGSDVKAGEVLFELQKSQYEASVQAAQAQLASARAALKNDQVAYERAARLSTQGFEAQSNLDSAIATRDQAVASVNSAQANLAQAALNLSYCTIKSPIDGRIGAVTLTKGNLVTPSTLALATINQLNPIRVVFSVADSDIVRVEQKTGYTQGEITHGLEVDLELPDGQTYPQTGEIVFLGNQVDQQTGTVAIYADFANPQNLLLPNTFVTVEVRRAKPEEQVLVPVAAVQTDQKGSYVLTVGTGNKVAEQSITTGAQIAQNFVVTKGLSAGQRVIVVGVQKVHPGEEVNPTAAASPPPTSTDTQATAQDDPSGKGG